MDKFLANMREAIQARPDTEPLDDARCALPLHRPAAARVYGIDAMRGWIEAMRAEGASDPLTDPVREGEGG